MLRNNNLHPFVSSRTPTPPPSALEGVMTLISPPSRRFNPPPTSRPPDRGRRALYCFAQAPGHRGTLPPAADVERGQGANLCRDLRPCWREPPEAVGSAWFGRWPLVRRLNARQTAILLQRSFGFQSRVKEFHGSLHHQTVQAVHSRLYEHRCKAAKHNKTIDDGFKFNMARKGFTDLAISPISAP